MSHRICESDLLLMGCLRVCSHVNMIKVFNSIILLDFNSITDLDMHSLAFSKYK